MKVDILQCTSEPVSVISLAAGCCYGKDDVSMKRIENCFKGRHMSVFEHAHVTFRVSDISRACTHQLVRHRLASYSQRSQRYTKLTKKDLKDRNWYVTPPDILNGDSKMEKWDYDACMSGFLVDYLGALEKGVKPEDARFLLPEAVKTEIVCSMNLREVYHFLDVRYSKNAQWEIRELASTLLETLKDRGNQWYNLMMLWERRENAPIDR